MKGSSKYNLLAKNESKKEKEQQEWIELQPVGNWRGKANNSDSSYMKFEEEQSQIGHDHVQQNKINEKSKAQSTQKNKNVEPSSNMEKKRMAYLQNQVQPSQSNFVPKQQNVSKVQAATQKVSNQQQHSLMKPQQIPSQYYQMPPFQNPYNNYNYNLQRSQMAYNQQPQSQILQPTFSSSTIKSQIRPTTRKGIPQMTVNCDKCTFTQSVPGNTQIYICCMCNQINECYPLYGVFTCGVCRTNVIYPHGTSRFIKCTKCLTVNKVNPQPSKKEDEVVTLGKEAIHLQEQNAQYVEYPNQKINPKPQHQPFKVLPSQKVSQNQIDFFDENNNNQPEITQDNQLRRQLVQPNEVKQKLIDFEQFVSQKKELRQDKELLELSQRLEAGLRIEDETNNLKSKQHQPQYPSIFD